MRIQEHDQSIVEAIAASAFPSAILATLALVADRQGYEYTRSDSGQEAHASGLVSIDPNQARAYYGRLLAQADTDKEYDEQLRYEAACVLQAYGWTLETLTFSTN